MAKPQQQTSEVSRIMKFGVTKICVTFNKSNQDTDESKILQYIAYKKIVRGIPGTTRFFGPPHIHSTCIV